MAYAKEMDEGSYSGLAAEWPKQMEYRPKILLPLSPWDVLLEILSALLLLSLWVVALHSYSSLPDIIPVHFNGSGQVDGYGSKRRFFSLPLVATIIYTGMTLLNRYPHIFNYAVTITPENAHRLYRTTTRMLRVLKLLVVVLFLAIILVVVRTSTGGNGPGPILIPVLVAPLVIFAGWMLVSVWRKN